jgi:hypothetical protein
LRLTHYLSDCGAAASRPLPSYDSAMHRGLSILRYLWAAPTTALGLLVVLAGLWRARARVVEGVLEAHGPVLAWLLTHLTPMPGGAAALTLGHVVIARDRRSLEETRTHERVHVRQCETWGPLFVPAYLTASLSAVWRGRNFYFDNRFEVEAFQTGPNRLGAQSAVTSEATLGWSLASTHALVRTPRETAQACAIPPDDQPDT